MGCSHYTAFAQGISASIFSANATKCPKNGPNYALSAINDAVSAINDAGSVYDRLSHICRQCLLHCILNRPQAPHALDDNQCEPYYDLVPTHPMRVLNAGLTGIHGKTASLKAVFFACDSLP